MDSIDRNKNLKKCELAALLALGRNCSVEGERPDLALLEEWRQGNISTQRSSEILSWLVRDPELMTQFYELEMADEAISHVEKTLLRDMHTHETPAFGWFEVLQKKATALLDRFHSYPLNGGLAAAAVMILVVVMAPKMLQQQSLVDEVSGYYQELATNPKVTSWPWRRSAQVKGIDGWQDPGRKPLGLERHSFQVGVYKGLHRLEVSGKPWQITLQHLAKKLPSCDKSDQDCSQRITLAELAGLWSVQVYYDGCRGGQQPVVAAQLGEKLLEKWKRVSQAQLPASTWPGSIKDVNICGRVVALLDWGLK